MKLFSIYLFSLCLLLSACSISVPEIKTGIKKPFKAEGLMQKLAGQYPVSEQTVLRAAKTVALPEIGDMTSYGAKVDAELKNAFHDFYAGRYQEALIALDNYGGLHSDDALALFQASFLKAQVLMAQGKANAAEQETHNTAKLERQLFDTDVNSRSLRGEALLWQDEWDKAIELLMQVAVQTQDWQLPDFYLAPPANLGELFNITTAQLRAYTVIATAYLQKNDFRQAKPWTQLTEAAYRRIFGVFEHGVYGQFIPLHADAYYGRAINLGVLAATRLAVDRQESQALELFDSGKHSLDEIGFHNSKIILDAFHAQALVKLGDCERAEKAVRPTIRQASERGMIDMLWRLQAQRGQCLLKTGQIEPAEQAFRDALKASNFVSTQLRSDSAKRRFGISRDDISRQLLAIDFASGNLEKLFADMELGRARAFVEMLAGHPVATARQPQLMRQIAELDTKIDRLRFINASSFGGDSGSIAGEQALMRERSEKIASLQRQDPELAQAIAVKDGLPLAGIQALLGDGETLAYVLPENGRQNISLLLVKNGSARLKTLALDYARLDSRLKRFRAFVGQGREKADEQRQALEVLYQQLELSGWGLEKRLYIVPSGKLHFIPWGGLPLELPVAVLPTANWLQRRLNADNGLSNPVIVGDPDFHGQLEQLEGARSEAEMIAKIHRHKALTGRQATLDNIRTEMGRKTRLLHFATHAYFDHEKPLDSALVLSGDDAVHLLTAADLFENPLPARLVVLSACESGAGQTVSGDDVLGLSRSFYLGGSASILNSLWPIEDQGAMEFMQVFHAEAINGDYGGAWLKARNQLRQQGFPPSVYGAFILGGMMKF